MRIIFTILFFIPLFLQAQESSKSAEVFCTNDYKGGSMIKIKWLYKSVYEPNGFDVYRQESGSSNWSKLNSGPVKVISALPANNKLDKEAKDLHNALVKTEFKDFSIGITRAFVLIKAIYVDELADYIGITFNDKNISNGKTYSYKVCQAGSTEPLGVSRPITASAYEKPGFPENVKFARHRKYVDISWKPDVYRYYAVDIYRRTTDETEFTKITKVPRAIQKEQADKYSEKSVFFQDTGIVYEANYIYKLVAIDYFGQSSEYTQEYSIAAADFIPPTAPFNVIPQGSSVNNSVRLDWNVVEESDLNGMNVYHASKYDGEYTKVNAEMLPKDKLNFTDVNVMPGGHYYRVSTLDIAGNESKSAPVFIEIRDIAPPAKPSGLTSESGEGFISLKWNANTEGDLGGYLVQRSLKKESGNNDSYVNVNKDPIKETSYTEKLPRNVRNEFVYRIVAIDTNFNRSTPSENTLAKMPDVIPPLQPVIKNVVPDTTKAVVTWLPNADQDLAGYNLYRRVFADSTSLKKVNFSIIPKSINTYTDRDASSGTAYEYFVEAVDQSNNPSVKSPAFYTMTLEKKMEGNVVLDVKKYNSKKGTLSLEWSVTINEKVKGFVVYRKLAEGTPFKPLSGLTEENRINLSIGKETGGVYYVKCYTENGKTIQSDNFNLIAE